MRDAHSYISVGTGRLTFNLFHLQPLHSNRQAIYLFAVRPKKTREIKNMDVSNVKQNDYNDYIMISVLIYLELSFCITHIDPFNAQFIFILVHLTYRVPMHCAYFHFFFFALYCISVIHKG